MTVLNSLISGGNGAFLGLQRGSETTVDPEARDPSTLLGCKGASPSRIGSDIPPVMGLAQGAIGFIPPMASGPFSVWVQAGNIPPSRCGLQFELVAVPEPAPTLLLTGLAAMPGFRRPHG